MEAYFKARKIENLVYLPGAEPKSLVIEINLLNQKIAFRPPENVFFYTDV